MAASNDSPQLARFRDRVAALPAGEPLQLEVGDLQAIADAVRRSSTHVHRTITGDLGRVSSRDLVADIEDVVGVSIDRIRVNGRKGRPRKSA